ncbi:hypothetical protein [Microvirga pakistanensis]|uniref:hypothetical protein n=1 Tax=Microvirga pakistanensis TaxID=1682650 RepID=UPI00106DAD5F|nr:hypothetical protein [Microvirga pakistanensis]
MDFIGHRTTTTRPHSGRFLATLVRLAIMAAAGAILLALVLVGFLVVLPLMLVGGVASYFYLRRRVRQARRQQRPDVEVIDAEYTIIDRR